VYLETEFAADTHLAEGRVCEKIPALGVEKPLKCPIETKALIMPKMGGRVLEIC